MVEEGGIVVVEQKEWERINNMLYGKWWWLEYYFIM